MILLLRRSIMQMNTNCCIVDTYYLQSNSELDQCHYALDTQICKWNDIQVRNDHSGLKVL
jgi:hypothetical protein